MTRESLASWLAKIESCHPKDIELGLSRIATVAARLQLSLAASHVITVAGTNGKGSSVASIERLLLSEGKTVGCYTSPHFIHYNERIRLQGKSIDDQSLVDAFEQIELARQNTQLTYFEYGTLAALLIFQKQTPDVVVLEVGLGGRLDATNIIDADIAIVNSIALDHEDWLGSDLEIIGREKAGIFRSNSWAISADPSVPESVKAVANACGARLLSRGCEFDLIEGRGQITWCGINAKGVKRSIALPTMPHLPIDSVVAAIQAVSLLFDQPIGDQAITDLVHCQLTGRFECLEYANKTIILDVAHNPAAAEHLATRIHNQYSQQVCYAVFAAMVDKDVTGVVSAMSATIDYWHVSALSKVSRAMSCRELESVLSAQHIHDYQAYSSPEEAIAMALSRMQDNDILIIFGSFFTVAAAKLWLSAQPAVHSVQQRGGL